MANYYGTARTNYFRVTNEDKYRALFQGLSGEDSIEDFTEEKDGVLWHGFGSYSSIDYYSVDTLSTFLDSDEAKNAKTLHIYVDEEERKVIKEGDKQLFVCGIDHENDGSLSVYLGKNRYDAYDEPDFEEFLSQLQTILDPRDVFCYMESGYEKLRYVTGFTWVVSKSEIRSMSLEHWAQEAAREMLENPEYCLNCSY